MPGTPGSNELAVEMRNIVKLFPGVVALDHVNFQLKPGEVHVLLGENGAGKSTLIKVLSGAYVADDGAILFDGKPVSVKSPQDALDHGLRFIYQELSLVRDLDIARNMFLGMEPMLVPALGLVDEKKLYQQAKELLAEFHINLDPNETIRRLSVTEQKMVEIARALTTKAKVIVLDEPTDVLEEQARKDLFAVIRRLKTEQNVAFVYISHRYAEVAEIGDRVTILRDGKNVGTYEIKDLAFDKMIELMIGGTIKRQYPDLSAPSEEDALRVDHLVRKDVLNDISLTIKKGEIVGVTGLMGAGKTELGRAVAGVDEFDSGEVAVQGKKVRCTTPQAGIREGIAYLPEDRKSLGLIQGQTIRDNYALPSLDRLTSMGVVDRGKIDKEIGEFMLRLAIKAPDAFTAAQQLSGGNQQKVVVAKWLGAEAKVLIFDEPTRGIDINGKREIYQIMHELLDRGVGILMLTSDYAEALEMSHRILVMRRGAVVRDFKRGEANEEDLLREAIGEVTNMAPTGPALAVSAVG
jgi:ribose transport system ATP-binding protein